MPLPVNLLANSTMPIALYSSEQLYAMEQAWFTDGNDSFGLMKQAAWQMAQYIAAQYEQKSINIHESDNINFYNRPAYSHRVSVWVGKGNKGGDGWMIAYYLQQMGWQVEVIAVGFDSHEFEIANTTQ